MALTKATYSMISGAYLNVLDFGAKGNGADNDTSAMNAAIAAAVTQRKTLFIPAGTYLLTSNITVPTPANSQYGFSIVGEGMHNGSILQFSGASVTTGLTFLSGVGVYQYWGMITELQINCVSGAKRGITIDYAHAPEIVDCQFNGATEYGLVVANANQPVVSGCLFKNNGSSGTAQVWLDYATAFSFRENYIASGGVGAVSGLDIDRCPTGTVLGGAIESTGIMIRIGEAAENTVACSDIKIDGVNMENPSTCYIRAGYGWTGTASLGVTSLYITNCRGYSSGSTTAVIGVDLKNTFATQVVSSNFGLSTGPTATINLNGTTNAGAVVGQSRTSFGAAIPWVYLNGAIVQDATPLTDWFQSTSNENILNVTRSATTATLDTNVFVTQGGLYNSIFLINAAPTTINRTANIPRINGTKLTLTALDANTTLAHLGGGGTGQFLLTGGVNLALVTNRAYTFSFNSNTGNWSQL
jgi:hypothetical protein